MSDEVETAVFVLHLLSGRYAEVHISWENCTSISLLFYCSLLSRVREYRIGER